MPQGSEIRPYHWLAQYYDELFSRFDLFRKARQHVLRRILPEVKSACDLACGTGTTAVILARRGIKMYGVDLSPLMCRLAREKARDAGVPLKVLRADMREFRLPETVDLVTCEGDALNHIPRKADLRAVAKSVSQALRPGGHFFFEVNNSLGFRRYWNGCMWFERPGFVVMMRNGHNKKADRAWSDVEWFIREGRLWRRRQERVEEVCWETEEIRRALLMAGFDQVRVWDAAQFFKGHPLIKAGCRSVYLATKSAAEQGSH